MENERKIIEQMPAYKVQLFLIIYKKNNNNVENVCLFHSSFSVKI